MSSLVPRFRSEYTSDRPKQFAGQRRLSWLCLYHLPQQKYAHEFLRFNALRRSTRHSTHSATAMR